MGFGRAQVPFSCSNKTCRDNKCVPFEEIFLVTWAEFVKAVPDLAKACEKLLWLEKPNKGGLGSLATVEADGGPRIHPVSPAIVGERLYTFVLKRSPKRNDLLRNGLYALHSFPDAGEQRKVDLTGLR